MALTALQLVNIMASYCGVYSLNPSHATNTKVTSPGLPPTLLDSAICEINGALQEIHNISPRAQYYHRQGAILNAPTDVTISLTANSDICSVSDYQQWMNGCTIRINGSPVVNELLGPCRLRRPYDGDTVSNITAKVYHDCIVQKSDVIGICGPIELPQIRVLSIESSREEFYRYEWNQLYGNDYTSGMMKIGVSAKIPAQPRAAYIDTEAKSSGMEIRLQILPIPDQRYLLHYGVIKNAFSIDKSNVLTLDSEGNMVVDGSGNPIDPGTIFNTPGEWDESVLKPMAVQRFTSHPNFGTGNPIAAAEIARQHQKAMDIIQNAAPNRAAVRMFTNFR